MRPRAVTSAMETLPMFVLIARGHEKGPSRGLLICATVTRRCHYLNNARKSIDAIGSDTAPIKLAFSGSSTSTSSSAWET